MISCWIQSLVASISYLMCSWIGVITWTEWVGWSFFRSHLASYMKSPSSGSNGAGGSEMASLTLVTVSAGSCSLCFSRKIAWTSSYGSSTLRDRPNEQGLFKPLPASHILMSHWLKLVKWPRSVGEGGDCTTQSHEGMIHSGPYCNNLLQ